LCLDTGDHACIGDKIAQAEQGDTETAQTGPLLHCIQEIGMAVGAAEGHGKYSSCQNLMLLIVDCASLHIILFRTTEENERVQSSFFA